MGLICYCFSYTEKDIVKDCRNNGGNSIILKRIEEAKKNYTCQCETKHPQKR